MSVEKPCQFCDRNRQSKQLFYSLAYDRYSNDYLQKPEVREKENIRTTTSAKHISRLRKKLRSQNAANVRNVYGSAGVRGGLAVRSNTGGTVIPPPYPNTVTERTSASPIMVTSPDTGAAAAAAAAGATPVGAVGAPAAPLWWIH